MIRLARQATSQEQHHHDTSNLAVRHVLPSQNALRDDVVRIPVSSGAPCRYRRQLAGRKPHNFGRRSHRATNGNENARLRGHLYSGGEKGIRLHRRRPRIGLQANPFDSPTQAKLLACFSPDVKTPACAGVRILAERRGFEPLIGY